MKEPSLITHYKDKIDISCTWGDGPDVCVNIYRNPESPSLNDYDNEFVPLDFTGDEAIKMGHMLIEAGRQAKKMDDLYRQDCEEHKND